ncbi:hypothetical protein PY257_06100 [Ramlibacter sp. H39-3-26]|uniref:hypothetical protein n=1 Tax=Curvibacter soli TaxID=3031331 RepID=UPI0023DAA255|nr:hypothetical protein [Ramlibacter sp. H39-3-26]MDF1484760.1 hypothetical protein [Ramlibacter sp. H39-3-26]
MTRCLRTFPFPPLARAALCAALALAAGSALAQYAKPADASIRDFPIQALRGKLEVVSPPAVQLDGKPDRLAPGARIRSTNSMMVLSGTIAGQSLVVNYVRDDLGLIKDVWILTPAEAALKRRGNSDTNNIVFESQLPAPRK